MQDFFVVRARERLPSARDVRHAPDLSEQRQQNAICCVETWGIPNEAVAEFSVAADVGRLTALDLNLPVQPYDFTKHYKAVRNKWLGFGSSE